MAVTIVFTLTGINSIIPLTDFSITGQLANTCDPEGSIVYIKIIHEKRCAYGELIEV